MYAKGIYYTSPRPERDQTNTMRAISAITEYLNRYPESTKKEALEDNLKELQQKLYDKSLMSSRLYYDIGYYNSAVTALQNALELYPETNHRELILYLIVRSHYMYARNSVESKQRERYLAMQDAYYNFVSEYPQSQYSKDVEKDAGRSEEIPGPILRNGDQGTIRYGGFGSGTPSSRTDRTAKNTSRKSGIAGRG